MNIKPILDFVNDLKDIDKREVITKIQQNAQISTTYIILLMGSVIISTFGLLLNNSPIILGGMIISPLMWPLMRMCIGANYGLPSTIRQSLASLVLSIGIAMTTGVAVTLLSPIRIIGTEIVSRSNPTLLDLLVALVAGIVAAVAMAQPKVSESLAGVAIATSIIPPLCVSAIGLAIGDQRMSVQAFLLFFTNAASIVAMGITVFNFLHIREQESSPLRRQAIIITGVTLLVTAIPLFFFLQNFVTASASREQVESILEDELISLSPSARLSEVQLDIEGDTAYIRATAVIPEQVLFTYRQEQDLTQKLQDAIDKEIDIELQIQRSVSIISESSLEESSKQTGLRNIFEKAVSDANNSLIINSLNISRGSSWRLDANLQIPSNQSLSLTQRDQLIAQVNREFGEDVDVTIQLIPLQQFTNDARSDEEIENDAIEELVRSYFEGINQSIEINNIFLGEVETSSDEDGADTRSIKILARAPDEVQIDRSQVFILKRTIEIETNDNFIIDFELESYSSLSL